MSDRKADAKVALMVMAAEDMYTDIGPAILQPALDPSIAASWDLCGYILGTDAVFRALGKLALGEQQVWYGLVLQSKADPDEFAAVIRGTAGAIEWAEDFEGLPATDPRFPGRVESGFAGIANTFVYQSVGEQIAPPITLAAALDGIVGSGHLMVCGHSLGSACATYVAYEAAKGLPGRVSLRVFASPHPGDSAFVRAVAAAIPDHVHYRNMADVVPKVPLGLGYAHLPNTVDLAPFSPQVRIKMNLGCLHHALSYAMLLDPDCVDMTKLTGAAREFVSCVVSL